MFPAPWLVKLDIGRSEWACISAISQLRPVQRPRYLVVEAGHLAGGAMSKQQAQIGTRRSVSRSLQSRLAVAVDYMAGFGFTHIKCVKQRGKESGLGDSSGPFGAT